MGNKNRFHRTCIVCGKKSRKEELLRLVLKENVVIMDKKMCLPGRGAYVCNLTCLEKVKKNQLERALKGKVVFDKQLFKI